MQGTSKQVFYEKSSYVSFMFQFNISVTVNLSKKNPN